MPVGIYSNGTIHSLYSLLEMAHDAKKVGFFFFLKFLPKSVIFTRDYLVDLRRKSNVLDLFFFCFSFFGGEGKDRSNSKEMGRCQSGQKSVDHFVVYDIKNMSIFFEQFKNYYQLFICL